jgi:adenylate kinase family enzyme
MLYQYSCLLYLHSGGPASGKGTQCDKLVEEFGYTHISVGDLVREEIKRGTKQGEQIKKFSDAGNLVPDELVVEVLINALIAKPSQVSHKLQN